MENSVRYQVFIGCRDAALREELVSEQELRGIVSSYFERKEIDFTVLSAKGGYRHEDGTFVTEDTLCIDIIGDSGLDIVKLARGLAMFMNQESALIMRSAVHMGFR